MAQDKLSNYKTTVHTDAEGWTQVIYQSTCIVKFKGHQIILNSGGWRTVTTKRKMNQAALQFGLAYAVGQTKGEWYVYPRNAQGHVMHDSKIDFEDNMLILDANKVGV